MSIQKPSDDELRKFGGVEPEPVEVEHSDKDLPGQKLIAGCNWSEDESKSVSTPFTDWARHYPSTMPTAGKEKLLAKDDLDYYRTSHMQGYVRPHAAGGWTSMPVLEFLWGLPLRNVILAYVHSLNPSSIRINGGECTTDAMLGRVTIIAEENDFGEEIVMEITQEVEVLYASGSDVEAARRELKEILDQRPYDEARPPD